MAREESPHRWPISPLSAEWRIVFCLRELGNLIQDRVEAWHRPPRDEEDDKIPEEEYAKIRDRRFAWSFTRPLAEDLRSVDFDRAKLWLRTNAPGIADEVSVKIEALAESIPLPCSMTPEEMIVVMADLAYYLHRVATAIDDPTEKGAGKNLETLIRTAIKEAVKEVQAQPAGRNIARTINEAGNAVQGSDDPSVARKTADAVDKPKKSKRSTQKGEGRVKLIAALTEHHKYANDGCLNLEPVGNNELAKKADVDKATASKFFEKEFGGHAEYRIMCNKALLLAASLKLLNDEYSPHLLFGAKPPGEDGRNDQDEE